MHAAHIRPLSQNASLRWKHGFQRAGQASAGYFHTLWSLLTGRGPNLFD